MYLSRLTINASRLASGWISNPYRVHQRLRMGLCEEPRLLFRIEDIGDFPVILVQSQQAPDWPAAFVDFPVLRGPAEGKPFELTLTDGGLYHFRLLANPTVKRAGIRLGLMSEGEQLAWLKRKLEEAGATPLEARISSAHLQHSEKSPSKDPAVQTHLAVLYDGVLRVNDPVKVTAAVCQGIGPAKGYGFGLLSLARYTL